MRRNARIILRPCRLKGVVSVPLNCVINQFQRIIFAPYTLEYDMPMEWEMRWFNIGLYFRASYVIRHCLVKSGGLTGWNQITWHLWSCQAAAIKCLGKMLAVFLLRHQLHLISLQTMQFYLLIWHWSSFQNLSFEFLIFQGKELQRVMIIECEWNMKSIYWVDHMKQ